MRGLRRRTYVNEVAGGHTLRHTVAMRDCEVYHVLLGPVYYQNVKMGFSCLLTMPSRLITCRRRGRQIVSLRKDML